MVSCDIFRIFNKKMYPDFLNLWRLYHFGGFLHFHHFQPVFLRQNSLFLDVDLNLRRDELMCECGCFFFWHFDGKFWEILKKFNWLHRRFFGFFDPKNPKIIIKNRIMLDPGSGSGVLYLDPKIRIKIRIWLTTWLL